MAKKDLIKSFLDKVKKAFANDNETQQEGNNDMNKKELILKTLEKMGYSPEVDNDGDIMLHYQMKTIYVLTGDEDEPYVSMMLPQFHEIDEGRETLVLAVCNKMTRELKVIYITFLTFQIIKVVKFFY